MRTENNSTETASREDTENHPGSRYWGASTSLYAG